MALTKSRARWTKYSALAETRELLRQASEMRLLGASAVERHQRVSFHASTTLFRGTLSPQALFKVFTLYLSTRPLNCPGGVFSVDRVKRPRLTPRVPQNMVVLAWQLTLL